MAESYDFETRQNAEDLYIIEGLTYEQVSERTGVSVTTLKDWGGDEKGKWRKKREEYRIAISDIKSKQVALKKALLDKAINTLDPQTIYAFSSLESATRQKKEAKVEVQQPGDAPVLRKIETPEDAVPAIREAVERKLNNMLATGNFKSADLADIEKSMRLVEALEEKYLKGSVTAETKKRSLDPDTLKTIREEIYGLR